MLDEKPRRSRVSAALIIVLAATTIITTVCSYGVVWKAEEFKRSLQEAKHAMSSTVYVTIVKGEIPDSGPPLIKVSITVTTNCADFPDDCAASHRQRVEQAAQGLINVEYEYP